MPDAPPTRRDILKLGSAAVVTGLAGCSSATRDAAGPDATTPSSDSTSSSAAESEYTRVYQETIDSVVLVQTDRGQGTGFVFDDSHVVTNAHVVGEASATDVRFTEGRWSGGEVVGTDPHSDLAALAVREVPAAATPLPFTDAEATVGQEVVAIGNPYNLDGTVTAGIVSGIDRSIPAPTGFRIPDAIQTDAPVNPGNSGGPLVSLDGRVVAVINSGAGDNIAFGVSAALTQRVVPELIESGEYHHSYLGVSFSDVTPDIAEANDLAEPRGLLVVDVATGGPSDGALQPSTDVRIADGARVPAGGDVILSVDGTEMQTSEDLGSYLALQTRPGDTVEMTIVRDGSERTVRVKLGTRPSP